MKRKFKQVDAFTDRPFRGNPVALNRAAAVIGDAEILQPKLAGGFGHFFDCVVTVACHCVAMKRAAQIFFFDQLQQRIFSRRFEFAAVFPQLRRNKIEIDRVVEIGFVAHVWNFFFWPFLLRFRIDGNEREPVFV